MKTKDLVTAAAAALSSYTAEEGKTPVRHAACCLVLPSKFRAPPKWPRGVLLREEADGSRVVAVNALKLLAWVDFAQRATEQCDDKALDYQLGRLFNK